MADKRKRVFGKGKTGALYLYDPRYVGFKVAQQYGKKALTNIDEWSTKYRKEIIGYAQDPDRVDITGQKLANWYTILRGALPQLKQFWAQLSEQQKQWVAEYEKQLREKAKEEQELYPLQYAPVTETTEIVPVEAPEETVTVSPRGRVTIRERA